MLVVVVVVVVVVFGGRVRGSIWGGGTRPSSGVMCGRVPSSSCSGYPLNPSCYIEGASQLMAHSPGGWMASEETMAYPWKGDQSPAILGCIALPGKLTSLPWPPHPLFSRL